MRCFAAMGVALLLLGIGLVVLNTAEFVVWSDEVAELETSNTNNSSAALHELSARLERLKNILCRNNKNRCGGGVQQKQKNGDETAEAATQSLDVLERLLLGNLRNKAEFADGDVEDDHALGILDSGMAKNSSNNTIIEEDAERAFWRRLSDDEMPRFYPAELLAEKDVQTMETFRLARVDAQSGSAMELLHELDRCRVALLGDSTMRNDAMRLYNALNFCGMAPLRAMHNVRDSDTIKNALHIAAIDPNDADWPRLLDRDRRFQFFEFAFATPAHPTCESIVVRYAQIYKPGVLDSFLPLSRWAVLGSSNSSTRAAGAVDPAEVVVVNWGAHFNMIESDVRKKFREQMEQHSPSIVTLAETAGATIVWRETYPQHFSTVDGMWRPVHLPDRLPIADFSQPKRINVEFGWCCTVPPANRIQLQRWKDAISLAVLRGALRNSSVTLRVARTFWLLAERPDGHAPMTKSLSLIASDAQNPESLRIQCHSDCTHFDIRNRPLAEAMIHSVVQALRAPPTLDF